MAFWVPTKYWEKEEVERKEDRRKWRSGQGEHLPMDGGQAGRRRKEKHEGNRK